MPCTPIAGYRCSDCGHTGLAMETTGAGGCKACGSTNWVVVGAGFICTREKRHRCAGCGKLGTTYQCDWKLPPRKAGGKPRTCDAHLCGACAREVAPDKHLCPPHQAAWDRHPSNRPGADRAPDRAAPTAPTARQGEAIGVESRERVSKCP